MSTTTAAYLALLGLDADLPPSVGSLVAIHRAHVQQLPYTNLDIMLRRPTSVRPRAALEHLVAVGRAGYCLHQNGALGRALLDLGFAVEHRHGHVWTRPEGRHGTELSHLVLHVAGLPTQDNPDGRWWPDVGLGEGPLDPVPLVEGDSVVTDGPLRFEVSVSGERWTLHNDPTGSFAGLEVCRRPAGRVEVDTAHAALSTGPDAPFAQKLVVQRRDPLGVDTVRGCTAVRVDAAGVHQRDLTTYDEWREAIDATGLAVADVTDDELRALFARSLDAHRAWVEAGRP